MEEKYLKENNRPISILPNVSKVYKILMDRLKQNYLRFNAVFKRDTMCNVVWYH